jgi:hypothetical protein
MHDTDGRQALNSASEATQGNPLFIQEVLHPLVKQDALQRRGGYPVATTVLADLQLPAHVMVRSSAALRGSVKLAARFSNWPPSSERAFPSRPYGC